MNEKPCSKVCLFVCGWASEWLQCLALSQNYEPGLAGKAPFQTRWQERRAGSEELQQGLLLLLPGSESLGRSLHLSLPHLLTGPLAHSSGNCCPLQSTELHEL